ncbi:MAG: FAD-dependent oxidoreductase [Candidatus Omnitrophota bacterium]|nr:FAD-dependent oxidoreductase [Candidatus Omnitrophota bacterium]
MEKELNTKAIQIIDRTPNVRSVRFVLPEPIEFFAGQFMFVTLNHEGKELSHPLSISNSPTEPGYVEFTKKISESEFSQLLRQLKVGDSVKLKLPFGKFTLNPGFKSVAYIAGGIGITPIRSMIKFATDKKLATGIVLFYSNHRPEDIVFLEDFAEMEKQNPLLKVVHTITCSEEIKEWQGRRGYIDEGLIQAAAPDYAQRKFYLCGPPKMMEVMQAMLKEKLCILPENIIIEKFSGY